MKGRLGFLGGEWARWGLLVLLCCFLAAPNRTALAFAPTPFKEAALFGVGHASITDNAIRRILVSGGVWGLGDECDPKPTCGCRVPGGRENGSAIWLVGLALLVSMRRFSARRRVR